MTKICHIYFLEMQHKPNYPSIDTTLSIEEYAKPISPDLFLDLYTQVGKDYRWTDRLIYTKTELSDILNQNKTHLYNFKVAREEVGFTELCVDNGQVEILFFGLFPSAIGRGWGQAFLQLSVEKAWSFSPSIVHLNTCDWDHPRALPNYLHAGFKEVSRKVKNQ